MESPYKIEMFANPFDKPRCLGFFPVGVTDGMILKTPAVAEIAILPPNSIGVDFIAQRAFVEGTIKIEVFGK